MFDPPLCPAGRFLDELVGIGERLAAGAGKRPDRFDSSDEFVELLARHGAFRQIRPDGLRLFAPASLPAETSNRTDRLPATVAGAAR